MLTAEPRRRLLPGGNNRAQITLTHVISTGWGFWQISSRGERSSNYKAVFQIKPSSEGKKVTSVQDTKPVDTSELLVTYKK